MHNVSQQPKTRIGASPVGVPYGKLCGIALSAGTMTVVASSAARPNEPSCERVVAFPSADFRESDPAPIVEPVTAAPTPARFGRTFDVSKFRRGNLHTHSNRSDGDSSPADVYAWYREHGYDFLVVTDHNTFTNPADHKEPGTSAFVAVGGEEVTMIGAGRQVHVNALCTDHRLRGGKFSSAQSALTYGVQEIRDAGGVALVNHPNFTWGIAPSDLQAARGAQLLEIHSAHPAVHASGNVSHPSEEALWDIALMSGLDFMGVAVDDAHHLRHLDRRGFSHPGREWVEVFSDSLDEASICHALAEGLLYASTGPSLARISVTDDTYSIWPVERDVEVQFVGTGGRLLEARKLGPTDAFVSYTIRGSEQYVRARVVDRARRTAWTPAVRIAPWNGQARASEASAQPPPG